MASLRSKFSDCMAVIGLAGLAAGLTAGALGLGFLLVIGIFALVTAVQAFILWVVWNWTAPLFTFIPADYQHLGFLTVWGAVAVVRIIGRIIFGTAKKDAK